MQVAGHTMGKGRLQQIAWLGPLLFLLALAAVAYRNADHEDLFFDSAQYDLLQGPATHPRETVTQFFRSPIRPGQQLTYLTFCLSATLNKAFGAHDMDVTGFLIFNVILHGLNAWLVYVLVRRLTVAADCQPPFSRLMAAAVAALFAVHPLHGASVAYIIQRRGLLATTFYLTGVILYLRARHLVPEPGDRSHPDRRWLSWIGVAVSYWAAFRSKEMALSLPLTLVLVEFCLRSTGRWSARKFRGCVGAGILLYVVSMLAGLMVLGRFNPADLSLSANAERLEYGVWPFFLSMCRVLMHYWKLLLLPLPPWMSIDHPLAVSSGLLEHGAIFALLGHLSIIVFGLALLRRGRRLAGLGILWFYAVQVPYMLLPQHELLVEYKTYLPSVGVALIIAELLGSARSPAQRRTCLAVLAVLTIVLLIATIRRNVVYQNQVNLWTDAAVKAPGYFRPHANLGGALIKVGRFADAERELDEALRLNPNSPEIFCSFGVLNLEQHRLDEAERFLTQSVSMWPHNPISLFNLANVLSLKNEPARAEPYYRRILSMRPDNAAAYNNLGSAVRLQQRFDEAMTCFEKAIQLTPCFGEAYKNRADLLFAQKKYAQAIQDYERAIGCDAKLLDAYGAMANCLRASGKLPEAVETCRRAIIAGSKDVTVREELAHTLDKLGRTDEALDVLRGLTELEPQNPQRFITLGAASFQAGRADEAVAAFERAWKLDASNPQSLFNIATILASQKRIEPAIERFREFLRHRPDHATAHNRLGYLLEQRGEKEEALAHYEQAAKLAPEDPIACWNLAEMYRSMGRSPEAGALYRQVLRLQPDHPQAAKRLEELTGAATQSGPASRPASGPTE